jgi:hypothetical protein
MAELPVRFRTSLRRHYPHQVQGVSSITPDSQPLRLPRSLLLGQNRTRRSEVNAAYAAPLAGQAAQSARPLPVAKVLTRVYPVGFAAVASFTFV